MIVTDTGMVTLMVRNETVTLSRFSILKSRTAAVTRTTSATYR